MENARIYLFIILKKWIKWRKKLNIQKKNQEELLFKFSDAKKKLLLITNLPPTLECFSYGPVSIISDSWF